MRPRKKVRRRWVVRCRRAKTGTETTVVIEVRGGVMAFSMQDTALAVHPEDGARLRQAWGEALAVALMDRGGW